MNNTQTLGDLSMAIHINRLLYKQGKISYDMFKKADYFFNEKLAALKAYSAEPHDDTISS